MADLPVVITSAGLQPQTPASLNAQVIAIAESLSPGLTANLPGSLVEDMSSTATGALVLIDQARVDLVNSLTPFGANLFLLNQLAQIYLGQGSTASPPSNTSVFVVFSTSPSTPGVIIPRSFIVSDGANQYTVVDGGVTSTDGTSPPLFAIASNPGSFAVPPGTVTTLVTSSPGSVTLTVTNPLTGTPGGVAQTAADRRGQVLLAGLAPAQGMVSYMKTLVDVVPGVPARLISVKQQSDGWKVIVGGNGDPYQIAGAIFRALFDVASLRGSVMSVASITKANPGVVTTTLNHGFLTGQTGVQVNGAIGMTAINGTPFTATVIDEKSFSTGINTTGFGTYTGGGVITPNFRNVAPNINQYPDTYTVPFVIPPLQTVTMTITWNTSSTNFVSPVGVAQLVQPAIADYINSIPVGAPINTFEMVAVFQTAVSPILSPVLLTRLIFTVSINGVVTAPVAGTGEIDGDPESFFTAAIPAITVIQG